MSFIFQFSILSILGLCWGSFLNVLAHRLVHNKSLLTTRSRCPSCNTVIAWYDNIPLLSWLLLRARCRSCSVKISLLYPAIELISAPIVAAVLYPVVMIPMEYFSWLLVGGVFLDLVFVSALIAATRTDFEAMVIPQCFTMWLVPVGIVASYSGLTLVGFAESLLGVLCGYGILWLVAFIFKRATGKDGMGEGDMELLAMIGAFLGPVGVWISLMIGSISGMILGGLYVLYAAKQRNTRIPFGPFLALGAVTYLLFYPVLLQFFIGA